MDEEENSKTIEFGISQESRLSFKSKTLGTVVPYRWNEYLVIGQKGISRFEADQVKETYPYELTALYRDVEHKLFIGVTAHTPEFIIIFEYDLNVHIKTGVKIDDYCVFNMIFSKKSSTIITAGSHMKTFKYSYIPSTCRVVFELPTIIIEPIDTIMYNCNWGILNPPMFDYDKEELLINDYKGNIISYNLRGRKNGIAVNYGCTDVESSFAYNSDTKQFISNNILQGAVIWNRNGSNSDQTFLGSSLTKFIQFINYEFVVLLDARNVLTIFDIITHDFFSVFQIDQEVSRIFYLPEPCPRLLICAKTDVIILRVTLPWRYWYTTGSRAIMLGRINKIDEAARIFVELSNAQIRLLSPINSRILTGITLKTLSSPITFFYDRGISDLPKIHRDQLLVPLVNGQMPIFSTGANPCEEVESIDLKILCVCQCIYKGKYAFCFGTNGGNLMFYDYITMKQIGRIVAYPAPVLNVFYHEESDFLLIAIDDRVLRMDLGTEHVIDFIRLKYSKLNLFFDGILFFAQDSGKIRSVCVAAEDPYLETDIKYKNNQKKKNESNKNQNIIDSNMTSRTNLNMVSKNNINISSKSTIKEKEEDNEKEKEKKNEKENKKEDEFVIKKLGIPYKYSLHHSNGMSMHDGQITGLSLGSVFFVSCSVDKTLRVWNRDFTQRCLIIFPLPLYSCCALNGKRDILVSTEKEIMIINGTRVFDDQVDPEDTSIDNYDRKQDSLYSETMTFFEEEEEVKEDMFDNQNKVEKKKSNKRRNRFADYMRKLEEENQRRIRAYLDQKDDPEYRKKLEKILEEAKNNPLLNKEEKEEEPKAKENEKEDEDEYDYEIEEEEEIIKEEVEIKPEETEEPEKEKSPSEEPTQKPEEEEKKKAVLSQFFGGAKKQPTKPKSPSRPAKQIDVKKYLPKAKSENDDKDNSKDQGQSEKENENEGKSKKKKGKESELDFEEKKTTKKKSSKKKQKQQQSHLLSPKKENPTKLSSKATNTESQSAANSEFTGSLYTPSTKTTTKTNSNTLSTTSPVSQPSFGPGFSKLTKQRRYPTPLKESKKVESTKKRPSSSIEQKKTNKRSKTPEPRMPIVDRLPNPPPLNIVFDIDMIERMIESGDDRYAPILNYLNSHGFVREGNTWDVKMSVPKYQSSSPSNKPRSPRRKRNGRSTASPNPNITNYPINDDTNNQNSKFMRQFMPPPMDQPDFDDEIGMKLFKNRVDELVGTKRLIPPSSSSNKKGRDGKIPSFQPKIVPTNQTQLDVAMYTDSMLKGAEKGSPQQGVRSNLGHPTEEQIAARRAALKRQQELRRQQLLLEQEERRKQEELERQRYVVHLTSSPPIIPPVPISNLSNGSGDEVSDIIGVQNLIPEDQPNSARDSTRNSPRVRISNRQNLSARDSTSPRRMQQQQQQRRPETSRTNFDFDFGRSPSSQKSSEGPHFVEPIMPVYLRASGEIFICDKKISPFACKRYRLVIDENGPKKSWSPISPQPPSSQNGQPLSSALITNQQQTSLIDQVNKSPRTVKKPLSQKTVRHV